MSKQTEFAPLIPRQRHGRWMLAYMALLATLVLSGCTRELLRNPVPLDDHERAEVVDLPGVRAWGDTPSPTFHDDLVQSILTEDADRFPRAPDGAFQYYGLALSGGGDHGAFGAGFLKGWSESRTRPHFKVVTGISTGALIAPFALLGSEYDPVIEEAYTTVTASEIYDQKSFLGSFFGEAMADNHPLQDLVHSVVSDQVIDAIGAAHRAGQRLYIGTTNLDAQRPVIWNMGAVANSNHPRAYEIFREILIASAAIPIVFPPVFIDVEIDEQLFDEMHVDGGTVGQLFFYGATLNWQQVLRDASGDTDPVDRSIYYAIVDGEVDPEPKNVERHLTPIMDRTVSTLIKVSAWSALYRMYLHAEQQGYQFRFVSLPDSYEPEIPEPYDPTEMRRMFDIGYEMGLSEDAWRSEPPGY